MSFHVYVGNKCPAIVIKITARFSSKGLLTCMKGGSSSHQEDPRSADHPIAICSSICYSLYMQRVVFFPSGRIFLVY